jgi:HPt (histidine-containing phosphotransfer) domain-containing protein
MSDRIGGEAAPGVRAAPQVDFAQLSQLELDVGPENLAGIGRSFVRGIRSLLRSISRCAERGDLAALERYAHRLKADAGQLGARGAQRGAASLEAAALAGKRDAVHELARELGALAGPELAAVESWLADRRAAG